MLALADVEAMWTLVVWLLMERIRSLGKDDRIPSAPPSMQHTFRLRLRLRFWFCLWFYLRLWFWLWLWLRLSLWLRGRLWGHLYFLYYLLFYLYTTCSESPGVRGGG